MGLFDKYKKKVKEELEEVKCNVCGHTLKDYKDSKNKKVCEECFSKIDEE
jgi:protein-arginine kinase activator protein McsA